MNYSDDTLVAITRALTKVDEWEKHLPAGSKLEDLLVALENEGLLIIQESVFNESLDMAQKLLGEALDTIQNLMAIVDSPLGRLHDRSNFAEESRVIAREVLKKNNRSNPAGTS